MFENLVELTLNGLKKRLDSDNTLIKQAEWGYAEQSKCYFRPPAPQNEIDSFFDELDLTIPNDFRQFLLIHNGAVLFEFEIFGYQQIFKHYIQWGDKERIPQGWYPIGVDANGDMLYIDSNHCKEKKRENEYLFWKEHDKNIDDSAIDITMNFERWLERFCVCNGEPFWLWQFETSQTYYDQLKQHISNIEKYHK